MEATVCQVAAVEIAEIIVEAPVRDESLATLSSTEMSFVGGGCLAVAFA
jgi:hypothetical protein